MAKIGQFEILESVGSGAMGSVYRAVDPIIGRPVAIKVIRLAGCDGPDEAAFLTHRLFREARAAGSLSHPGIVTVYQVGTEDHQAYIAMEYIDGPTLAGLLGSETRPEPALLFRVLREAAAALDHAHERGIIHRDIKPANIMLTAAGAVKLTDFGIAKSTLAQTETRTGMTLGTPFYMSPEQVQGLPLDGRSDQFALAVIAYQMLTGRRPFDGDTATSICYQIVHAEPPPADLQYGMPAAVSHVLKRALAKDPARRFATCTLFVTELVRACEQTVATQALPAPPSHPRRRVFLGATIGALGVIGLIASGVTLFGGRQPAVARTVPPPQPRPEAVSPQPDAAADSSEPKAEKSRGRIVWTGQARKGALIRIDGGAASVGALYGNFPGGPIEIRVFPADRALRRLTVFTSDAKYATAVRTATAAGPALFSWDPRHMTDVTIWEKPSPGNHWDRCTLRVNTSQLTASVIEWRKI